MISVENVSKKYIGFSNLLERVLSVISLGLFKGTSQYIALNKLNFNAEKGQIIGVIGRNGAGKSTLLKILSNVSMVDSGKITISGVIRPMLELGVGFNPELTGLENIRFNGLLWGYSSDEIQKLEKEIFQFAGLVGLENQILKNYSTGMTMRLGFSLATANRPDILLIDEALAVGDASFQVKCLDRFKKFIEQGSIIIVVSHDLQMMSAICQKIILLEKGNLEFFGNPTLALRKYFEILGKNEDNYNFSEDMLLYYNVKLFDEQNNNRNIFFLNQTVKLEIKFKFKSEIPRLTVGFQIDDNRGIRVFGINSYILDKEIYNLKSNWEYSIIFSFPLNFREGKYSLGISFHKGDSHIEGCYLWKDSILDFEIERIELPKFDGLVYLPTTCEWKNQEL